MRKPFAQGKSQFKYEKAVSSVLLTKRLCLILCLIIFAVSIASHFDRARPHSALSKPRCEGELRNIKFGRHIEVVRDIFTVFLALADAFCQQIFNLTVDTAEIVLCPACYGLVQLRRKPQRYLLLSVIAHL